MYNDCSHLLERSFYTRNSLILSVTHQIWGLSIKSRYVTTVVYPISTFEYLLFILYVVLYMVSTTLYNMINFYFHILKRPPKGISTAKVQFSLPMPLWRQYFSGTVFICNDHNTIDFYYSWFRYYATQSHHTYPPSSDNKVIWLHRNLSLCPPHTLQNHMSLIFFHQFKYHVHPSEIFSSGHVLRIPQLFQLHSLICHQNVFCQLLCKLQKITSAICFSCRNAIFPRKIYDSMIM